MIPFKVRKKNDYFENHIYTVYDIDHFKGLTGEDTRFFVYDSYIGKWVWVNAEEYEPVEEDDNNGSA